MAQRPLAGGPLSTAPASGTNSAQTAIQSSLASLANLTLRQIVLATLTVLAVTLAFLLLYRFYTVVFLLFVAIAIQIALDPLVRFLAARGINRIAAMFAIYILLFAAIGAVIWFGAAPLADQVRDVASTLPNYYHNLRDSLLHAPIGFVRGLASVLPAEPSPALVMAAINQGGGEAAADAAASAADAAQAANNGMPPTQAWLWFTTVAQGILWVVCRVCHCLLLVPGKRRYRASLDSKGAGCTP